MIMGPSRDCRLLCPPPSTARQGVARALERLERLAAHGGMDVQVRHPADRRVDLRAHRVENAGAGPQCNAAAPHSVAFELICRAVCLSDRPVASPRSRSITARHRDDFERRLSSACEQTQRLYPWVEAEIGPAAEEMVQRVAGDIAVSAGIDHWRSPKPPSIIIDPAPRASCVT